MRPHFFLFFSFLLFRYFFLIFDFLPFLKKSEKEENDVEQLKKVSIESVKARIRGNFQKQVQKEEKEFFEASEKLHAEEQALVTLEQRLHTHTEKYKALSAQKEKLDSARTEMMKLFSTVFSSSASAAKNHSPLEAETAEAQKHYAKVTRDLALYHLARDHLIQSRIHLDACVKFLMAANSMATLDVFTSHSYFIDAIKHSDLGKARDESLAAENHYTSAKAILPAIPAVSVSKIAKGNYFVDMFLDSKVTDILIKQKINESLALVKTSHDELVHAISWIDETTQKVVRAHQVALNNYSEKRSALTKEESAKILAFLQN